MKWSSYNLLHKKDSTTYVLYNYANDSIIFLVPKLAEIIKKHKNEVKELSLIHPDLYHELIKKEFIIDKNIKEQKEVLSKVTKHLESSDVFRLTINPTLDCNLKCWYCYETLIQKSTINEAVFRGVKKIISKKMEDKRNKILFLSFFGGEPLLRNKQNILTLINFAQECCNKNNKKLIILFTTNAVLLDKKFTEKLVKITSDITVQIPFDGNRDKHNETKKFSNGKGSYDIIINNLVFALRAGIKANIRCNYTKDNISSFKDLIEEVHIKASDYKDSITFQMQQIWQTESQNNDGLPQKMDKIKKYLSLKGFNNNLLGEGTISSYCYADYTNSMVINYNGDVFKCTARDFKKENRVGKLKEDGSIVYEKNYIERLKYRFNNECLNCSILPICTICSQKRFEFKNLNRCPLEISEEDKQGQIKYRLDALCSQYI